MSTENEAMLENTLSGIGECHVKNLPAGEPFTVSITRVGKAGCEAAYEEALHRFIDRSLTYPGQLGVHVVRPAEGSGSREYGVLRRFASKEDAEIFYRSDLFQEWRAESAEYAEGDPQYEFISGMETWFTA